MSGSSERRVPAVVIGGELNGLGVCRSLAMGGMPIWVVDRKRSNPALWSRYAHKVLTNALHGPGFIDFLRDLQRRTLAGVNIPLIACRHELALRPFPGEPIDGRMVWRSSWIEWIRRGATPIPPRSVMVDGYWRRDDPLPALVHHPHNAAYGVALHLRSWLAEWQRKLCAAVSQRPSVA
ncbi:hypothetical protein [Bradyrhizobium sp. SSUT77]|uniref:hypothetical protein n=1 Tax=Bradyrhizobium sp. SSUT77 TaxID=3040603 RepID=UPI00244CBBCD|nr:hypothetical protein [Bradyrhizobium sp. SSUT77]MDH2347384.1 hypothetical protein [Bradyrhizobium sp. SSUT77]